MPKHTHTHTHTQVFENLSSSLYGLACQYSHLNHWLTMQGTQVQIPCCLSNVLWCPCKVTLKCSDVHSSFSCMPFMCKFYYWPWSNNVRTIKSKCAEKCCIVSPIRSSAWTWVNMIRCKTLRNWDSTCWRAHWWLERWNAVGLYVSVPCASMPSEVWARRRLTQYCLPSPKSLAKAGSDRVKIEMQAEWWEKSIW